HRVGIATPDGSILEEFDISHTDAGFQEFFRRVEERRQQLSLPVAVAMEGYNGYARPLDRLVQEKGYRLFNVNNLKLARFKEVFPGAAKTDPIDTRKILELFRLKDQLPLAKDAIQEVVMASAVNEKLKRLSRRRRRLVIEKMRVLNRMQADLQAVCPGLLAATHAADNLWFLRLLTFREDLRQLARLRMTTVFQIRGVGQKYAGIIRDWQRKAKFSSEVEYVGPMIIQDARRILELHQQIRALDDAMEELADQSEIARRLSTIPGFGKTSIAELAGEIGTMQRFSAETSLALYLGMCPLTHQSGQMCRARIPRQVNTRCKAALMTTVARHIGCVPESRTYYDRKRAEGKTHNQAIRALGRHMVRVIWAMLRDGRDYEIREDVHPLT
ncbi:IS110 family transposase, partial [Candidatus Bipolaricaulota bacterium]|nr:IS110 family transposase [Candidatus Bipolaricaulota bacterium]